MERCPFPIPHAPLSLEMSNFSKSAFSYIAALAICGVVFSPASLWSRTFFEGRAERDPSEIPDRFSRLEVVEFFNEYYRGSQNFTDTWNGDVGNCIPGVHSDSFYNAVIDRINYYRMMTGIPPVALDSFYNKVSQEAALMMSAESQLSHTPPESWKCYTKNGDQAALRSNLALNFFGPDAVDAYIGKYFIEQPYLGHRRWLLYPRQDVFGTGDIPDRPNIDSSNVMFVFAPFVDRFRDELFVAWPPEGYVPHQVTFKRWHFSLNRDKAYYGQASVEVRQDGQLLPVIVEQQQFVDQIGDNAIIWQMESFPLEAPPATDLTYDVKISNVMWNNEPHTFEYSVTVIDPDRTVGTPPFIEPIEDQTAVEGASYSGPIPVVTEGTEPISWKILQGPEGMTIEAATAALERWIDGREVACAAPDQDGYGRWLAVCWRDDRFELNAELARQGWALPYRPGDDPFARPDYASEAAEAESHGRGLWRGDFTPPWQWRRRDASRARTDASPES